LEFEIVENFIRQRKVETEDRKNALLFSQQTNHDMMFDDSKIRNQITELLSNYSDLRIVSYQFRHTSISYLQLIIFSDIQTTQQYTGYSENQISRIRRFFTIHQNDFYHQISAVVGHISPFTTITTYSHFTDLLLGQYLMNSKRKESIQFWSKLSGLSEVRLSNHLMGNFDLNKNIEASEIVVFFDKQLKKHSTNIGIKMGTPVSPTSKLKHVFEPSLIHCERILKGHGNGKTKSNISAALTLPEKYVLAVIEAAIAIKHHHKYQTKRGKSRLISSSSDCIRPSKMSSKVEDTDRLKICNHLLTKNLLKPKSSRIIIDHPLSTTSHDHSYIPFKSAERAMQFVLFFAPIITQERWHLIIEPDEKLLGVENWEQVKNKVANIEISGKTKRNTKLFPQGQGNLHLLHPNASEILATRTSQKNNKYSTNSLKNACHWVAIHLKSIQLYAE